jgi:putative metalloenzyme radical SAM/SPASM domain maturase
MCLKFAKGSCIDEGDMPLALFKKLVPSLAHTRFLVLNGIGEPLLHPDLEEIITIARAAMPPDGRIGFQSNGLLLHQKRSLQLIAAGLDTICLSLDNLNAQNADKASQEGHQLVSVEKAIANLSEARKTVNRAVRLGIEVVLQKETLRQLPALVAWAHRHAVDYIIASHLFSYDGAMTEQSLFNPNSYEATQLFAKWTAEAVAQGVNLAALPSAQLKFSKSPADILILHIGSAMHKEARDKDIALNFPALVAQSSRDMGAIEEQFCRARALAADQGIELFLPPLYAQADGHRFCPFIEEHAVFINKSGKVMPCHFLWHTCPGMVNQEQIHIEELVFGNIDEQPLEGIWQQAEYANFRAEAGFNDYAPCWSCTSAPCADLVNANLLGANDCYGSHVPCGHCMWGIGWLKCL